MAFGSTLQDFLSQAEVEVTWGVLEVFLEEVTLNICFEGWIDVRPVKKYKRGFQNEACFVFVTYDIKGDGW